MNRHRHARNEVVEEHRPLNFARIAETIKWAASRIRKCIMFFASQLLLADVRWKAAVYVLLILMASVYSEYNQPLFDQYYVVRKDNVFNQYGTKMGWLWTSLLLLPFIWLTAMLRTNHRFYNAFFSTLRVIIASTLWFLCTKGFNRLEAHTAECIAGSSNLAPQDIYSPIECVNWAPGFDISGHTFLLLFSILILTEEARAYDELPPCPAPNDEHIPNRDEYLSFKRMRNVAQALYIALFFLHLFWDFQLIVTVLHYHTLAHKLVGALVAVACWYLTYKLGGCPIDAPGRVRLATD